LRIFFYFGTCLFVLTAFNTPPPPPLVSVLKFEVKS
jgi:hypothetical protein